MRPMILTMSAFGSYADCVTIDFGQVQQGVFLITGDTGARQRSLMGSPMHCMDRPAVDGETEP